MRWERRVPLPWLAFAVVSICAWCSLLSGIIGWATGRDLAQREANITLATAVAGRVELPPLGVLVTRLDRTGPAADAGIARGDIIVAIDGIHVEDARDLREELRAYAPGDTVILSVVRDDGTDEVKVRLGRFPGEADRPYLGIYYTARGEEPADL